MLGWGVLYSNINTIQIKNVWRVGECGYTVRLELEQFEKEGKIF